MTQRPAPTPPERRKMLQPGEGVYKNTEPKRARHKSRIREHVNWTAMGAPRKKEGVGGGPGKGWPGPYGGRKGQRAFPPPPHQDSKDWATRMPYEAQGDSRGDQKTQSKSDGMAAARPQEDSRIGYRGGRGPS